MRVLIISSLNSHITTAAQIARSKGVQVSHVDTIEMGMKELREGRGADLILADVACNIEKLIRCLENERINVPVAACGIVVTPEQASKAIQAGAREYIPLPPDAELIAAVLEAVTQEDSPFIFKDPQMKKWMEFANRIAPSEATVLITGESGTGKEVMARYVHQKSKRAHQPFISLNCAAIPENLLESELFGHEKGSFTGAVARRVGKFEEANGGTLLLDEISEMDPRLQAKLLRAIQEREIDRVGGNQPVKVDIRIIATSNRDLLQAVKNNQFREDLYFRLNVVNIQIPPLRQRPKDIEVLSKHFAVKYATLNGMTSKDFSPDALQFLISYYWNGNVRELENTIHRAVLLSQGDLIEKEDISYNTLISTGKNYHDNDSNNTLEFSDNNNDSTSQSSNQPNNNDFVGRTVSDVERELILGTLDHCLGNRTHAANILGISIRTLRNKLKEYEEDRMNNSQLLA
jgi:two-component system response regulator FlrC